MWRGIYRGKVHNFSHVASEKKRKEICIAIGKDKSVLNRELNRNCGKRGYSPRLAQEYANERKERFKYNRKFTPAVRHKIINELTQYQWSLE